jgi:uncharacterized protein YndB with AHSA1/START domain
MQFENTVTIRRPAEDVFVFLADFENVPSWNHAIQSTTKTSPGPVGVGSTYRQIRSEPKSEEGFEVTVFEPTRRLAIDGEIGPFHARVDYRLEADRGSDEAHQRRRARAVVGRLEAPRAVRGFQGQGRRRREPRHVEADPGNGSQVVRLICVARTPGPLSPRRTITTCGAAPPHRRPGSPMSSHPRSSRPGPASPRRRSNASSRAASWSGVTGASPSERSTP